MGDDSEIQAEGKGTIKLEHGVLKTVLYVHSLAANLLYAYQKNHIGSPKRVVFDLESMEISYISIGKLIAKGVANHASKAYEFSHFFPYSDPLQNLQPVKREGKSIIPKPFAHDNISCGYSDP